MVVSLAKLIEIDLNKFERINSRKGKELLRKNYVALYLPHVSLIPTWPKPLIAQPRQRWVFYPFRGGATKVLRIQEKVTVRRVVYHYDRCQVDVQ